ncbi:hypothetical protein ACGFJT_41720 [Actinomadura geliboluensis]|uniref:hypothetical protein n=1 Tax=Actinomadura geliboluensis TaxID=882440 RepID=UPI00372365F5
MPEPHHPEVAHDPEFGGIARCDGCTWRQTFNEDLHEFAEGDLLDWHAANPGYTIDHLSADALTAGLAIPDYVQWAPTAAGLLALADARTGRVYSGYNHESLAIYESVTETGGLDQAVHANARRLDITPRQALGDIVFIATGFYRCGLLGPTNSPRNQ